MARNDRLGRAALDLVRAILKPAGAGKKPASATRTKPSAAGASRMGSNGHDASPGQYGPGATRDLTRAESAQISPSYSPSADGDPDPGEVIWTWVPYVENDGRGKGSGARDSKGRESFLNPERLLRITDEGMRREGTVMPKARFGAATAEIMRRL